MCQLSSPRTLWPCIKVHESGGARAGERGESFIGSSAMVVHVIYTRREQGGRGKSLVRLAGSVAAVAATAAGGRSLSRAGGRTLRATSPPPHAYVPASWESRSLRRGGDEDWEEVVAAPDSPEEVTDEYKVAFGAPPTDDEVRAAVASIKQ